MYQWAEFLMSVPLPDDAQIGGMLAAVELMEISSTIRASRILRNFIEDLEADEVIDIPHFISKRKQCLS